jgi:hypothetical protein
MTRVIRPTTPLSPSHGGPTAAPSGPAKPPAARPIGAPTTDGVDRRDRSGSIRCTLARGIDSALERLGLGGLNPALHGISCGERSSAGRPAEAGNDCTDGACEPTPPGEPEQQPPGYGTPEHPNQYYGPGAGPMPRWYQAQRGC